MNRKYFRLADLYGELAAARKEDMRFDRLMRFRVERLGQLLGRLPQQGEAFFIETGKSFTAFTFVVYVARHAGPVSDLYIATYSTNQRVINALLRMRRQGLVGNVRMHVSETLRYRMPEVWEELRRLDRCGEIRMTAAWSHKKVAAMRTAQGCFVVEGSGNYGENALEEQYVFIKSEEVYEFRQGNRPAE